jgi:sporulation protein YlmC with PRC-barrel domain
MAQDMKTPAPAAPAASATAAPGAKSAMLSLTSEEAKAWVGKPVYSSDGTKLGEVGAFQLGADNKVTGLFADIGGYLGIGEHRIKLMPAQITLQADRVVLDLTAAQAKELPKVAK